MFARASFLGLTVTALAACGGSSNEAADAAPDHADAAQQPDAPPETDADVGVAACDAPTAITASGSYVADTTGFADLDDGSCQSPSGAEVAFELTLSARSDVYVDTEGSDFDTVLYVRASDCASGTEVACSDDADSATWSRLLLPALDAGTYYIIVDTKEAGGSVSLDVVITPVGVAPSPAVADDPLVRMPGTQPDTGVALNSVATCLACHADYDPSIEPGDNWKGSMMAEAARDPLYWPALVVTLQDSVWATGSPNAGDLCLRCHMPAGWLGGRSSEPNASLMTADDYEGVQCDTCHRMYDPFYASTADGSREGNDWTGYWDESGASGTPSSTAAATTYAADQTEAATVTLFNGNAFFSGDEPVQTGYTEASGGQYYVSTQSDSRASFADAAATHDTLYSRFHKSRYFCGACHDVSNSVLANLDDAGTSPGDGVTVLPSEQQLAGAYFHIERTFSEFSLSAFGAQGGATGTGHFDPGSFATSLPGNAIARCQDCHMADAVGAGSSLPAALVRPTESVEHPNSGLPVHDLTGGNAFSAWLLASTVPGSSNYDATNATLLGAGAAALTVDLGFGHDLDAAALLAGANRSIANLQNAASIELVDYVPSTGALAFRIRNHTGHKLISGYPEGRRMFVNVRAFASDTLIWEVNPYDATAGTLRGLPSEWAPSSPALGANESHDDALVYEVHMQSALTGEEHSFHIALATARYKDNRIPPQGFRIADAAARLAEPVWQGVSSPGYFTAAEYAGGWDDVSTTIATGADRIEIRLYYQTTSREYIEFLRDEINGDGSSLASPTPSGRALAYIAQDDSYFSAMSAWGDTIWQLWEHNKDVPGAAPVLMAEAIVSE